MTSLRHHAADRVAALDAAEVLLGAALLLVVARRGDAEATEAAVGGVELGARAGDRHPHRRVRLLHRLRQHVAFGHREAVALVRHVLVGPHLRQHPHELVPRLLGVVGIGVEAAELGPRGADRAVPTSSRPPEMMSSVAQRSATRIGWFISGTHTTAPWPMRMRSVCARHRGEHHLGRRAVRVLLEEVVLDRPHPVEAELVGEARLLERVAEHAGLDLGRERARRGHLEEDAELHAGDPKAVWLHSRQMTVRLAAPRARRSTCRRLHRTSTTSP